MKSVLISFLFGFFSTFGLSQTGEIRGFIRLLPDNIPFVGCPIWIGEGNYGTTADSLGFYSLSNIPSGNYVVHSQWTETCEICIPDVKVLNGTSVNLDLQLQECGFLGGHVFCPKCFKSDQIIPIVYGKPSRKTIEKASKNEVHLGGCMVTECDPNLYCLRDSTEFKF